MAYAKGTTIDFDKSVAEIIALVKRHGAQQIGQFESDRDYALQFTLSDRMIRFRLPLPALGEIPMFNGRRELLTSDQRHGRLDQAKRQRGRALLLVIKAKLESVESGIETIEQAFLAQVVTVDGRTVHERVSEGLAFEYQSGQPSAAVGLLPAPEARR